ALAKSAAAGAAPVKAMTAANNARRRHLSIISSLLRGLRTRWSRRRQCLSIRLLDAQLHLLRIEDWANAMLLPGRLLERGPVGRAWVVVREFFREHAQVVVRSETQSVPVAAPRIVERQGHVRDRIELGGRCLVAGPAIGLYFDI